MAFEATKREWGELYAFFRLLADGYVYAGKADAKKNEELRYPVAMVQREEHDGTRHYIIENECIYIKGETVVILSDTFTLSALNTLGLMLRTSTPALPRKPPFL